MHGLEAVAHVGQRPADDHAHGVVEVGGAHLVRDLDLFYAALSVSRVMRAYRAGRVERYHVQVRT